MQCCIEIFFLEIAENLHSLLIGTLDTFKRLLLRFNKICSSFYQINKVIALNSFNTLVYRNSVISSSLVFYLVFQAYSFSQPIFATTKNSIHFILNFFYRNKQDKGKKRTLIKNQNFRLCVLKHQAGKIFLKNFYKKLSYTLGIKMVQIKKIFDYKNYFHFLTPHHWWVQKQSTTILSVKYIPISSLMPKTLVVYIF